MKRGIYLAVLGALVLGAGIVTTGGAQVYPVRWNQERAEPRSAAPTPPSLVLADGGIEFPDGTIQTAAASQGPTFVLLDGNLQEVGKVVPGVLATYVEMDFSDERLVLLVVSRDRIRIANGTDAALYYTSTDCSGTPYMITSFVPFMVGPLGLLYRTNAVDPPATRTFESGSSRDQSCFSTYQMAESQEAVPVADFETLYPPPYSTDRL